MRAHDQQPKFRIITTVAATARNIQLIVETIIASHTSIAFHWTLKERCRTRVSVYGLVLSLRVMC